MCGETVLAEAVKCRYCGELIASRSRERAGFRDRFRPTAVEFGSVFESAWKVFQQNMGILIGIFVLNLLISSVLNFGTAIPIGVFAAAAERQGADAAGFFALLQVMHSLLMGALGLYLAAGQVHCNLRASRGAEVQISHMFGGWHSILGAMVVQFLFGLGLVFCLLLLIVPGVFFYLYFWPVVHVYIDRQCSISQAFGLSARIAGINKLNSLLLGLTTLGLFLLGYVTCCIGLVFTIPLASMVPPGGGGGGGAAGLNRVDCPIEPGFPRSLSGPLHSRTAGNESQRPSWPGSPFVPRRTPHAILDRPAPCPTARPSV
jgi:hypothetical protein